MTNPEPHHDNTKNSGGQIDGNGTVGRRLWMMGPDGWMAMPTGGGVDSTIRSVNFRDGAHQRWQQISYGGGHPVTKVPGATGIPKFSVRFPPTIQWTNTGENPLYTSALDTQTWDADRKPGWTVLSFTKPRVDPSWRIVSLLLPYPQAPATQSVQAKYYLFYPRGGTLETIVQEDNVTHQAQMTNNRIPLTRVPWVDQSGNPVYDELAMYRTDTFGPGYDPDPGVHRTNVTRTAGTVLDLTIIRQKLADFFPESDPYFNGCYDDMSLMSIRRVYVTYNVTCSAQLSQFSGGNYVGPGGNAGLLTGIRYRVMSNTNFPTDSSTMDPVMASQYNVNYPVQTPLSLVPSGTAVFDQTGVGPDGLTLTGQTLTFEGPPENNISFIPVIENIPPVDANNNYLLVDFRFQATQITIHYAEGQNDTPVDLHDPSVTTLDVA